MALALLGILLAAQAPSAGKGADPENRPAVPSTMPAKPEHLGRPNREKLARDHYRTGERLLQNGGRGEALSQALYEFQTAHELSPRPENLAMMGHCEYHLGMLKEARAHYEEYLNQVSTGELAEQARQRIEAMSRRKARLIINSMPEAVDVAVERLDGEEAPITGQAPNEFLVPAGRWRVTVRKPKYITQSKEIALESVDTKSLFFPLERQPARLQIFTEPPGATLYVRGNRARNPYIQDVEPGSYEVYAEAGNYESRSETFVVLPGEDRKIPFRLNYVQRSGRPELIGFWTATGALAGGVGVGAWLSRADLTRSTFQSVSASATVVAGAALVGGVGGALTSTAFVPNYIRDNRALFRIGAAWIGAAEGASLGVTLRHSTAAGWMGGAAGLGLGAVLGRSLDRTAPNYGRVAMVQSGAAIGAIAGALSVPAFNIRTRHGANAILAGLNLGLSAGVAMAYLPDQSTYGPPWDRVLLVDMATAAGGIAGALVRIVSACLQGGTIVPSPDGGGKGQCAFAPTDGKPTAQFALVGGGLGLAAGWLLTRNYRSGQPTPPSERWPLSMVPLPTVLPVLAADGRTHPLPALAAQGPF